MRFLTDMISLGDQVRAIALEGLKFTKDPYDKDRYEHLLQLATSPFSKALDLDFDRLSQQFRQELGCATPKLGTDVAVINELEQLLILERSDGTGWCLPCGWVNVGENPAQAAQREVREETGLIIDVLGCIALTTKGPGMTQNIQHQVNILVTARTQAPNALILNHEHINFQWINRESSIHWHPGHDRQANLAFEFLRNDRGPLLPIK